MKDSSIRLDVDIVKRIIKISKRWKILFKESLELN